MLQSACRTSMSTYASDSLRVGPPGYERVCQCAEWFFQVTMFLEKESEIINGCIVSPNLIKP